MSSTEDTNNKLEKKEREKRSMSKSYIAENVDPDSDLSLDGTVKPQFHDDVNEQTESVTEPDYMKRKEKKKKQGIDGKMHEVFEDSIEEETHREKNNSPKNKQKSKRKSSFHDEENTKRAKGEHSNSNGNSSNQHLDHRGEQRSSFHDSPEEDN